MRDRFVSACVACVFVVATMVSIAHAEDADPKGRLAYWDIAYNPLYGSCTLATYAYEPGGGLTPLTFEWIAFRGLQVTRSLLRPRSGQLRIETVGSPDSWTIPLDAQNPKFSAADIDALLTNIGQGFRLVLNASPEDGPALRYVATLQGAPVVVAMFRACAQASKDHPPPESYGSESPFRATQSDQSCVLGRGYAFTRAELNLALVETPEGGAVTVSPGAIWVGSHSQNEVNGRPPLAPGLHVTHRPFVAELDDMFAARIESTEPASAALTSEQLNALERELMNGGRRKVVLSVKGESKLRDTFGGELAIVPAAMFSACRKAKFPNAEQVRP